jgi:hypothetical protein
MPTSVESYAETLERIEQAHAILDELRELPPTPKRDAAIAILEEDLGHAIMVVRELGP